MFALSYQAFFMYCSGFKVLNIVPFRSLLLPKDCTLGTCHSFYPFVN